MDQYKEMVQRHIGVKNGNEERIGRTMIVIEAEQKEGGDEGENKMVTGCFLGQGWDKRGPN